MLTMQTQNVTQLLHNWNEGDPTALDHLMSVVYQELRKLAGGYLKNQRPSHTLQPTALVHEAYLRLAQQNTPQWQSRNHFYGVAARLMRQILVDYARNHNADKRGGRQVKLSLDDAPMLTQKSVTEVMELDQALAELATFDERKSRVLEMRYFAGLTEDEMAQALGISERTVRREMQLAKAWLRRQLTSVQ